MESRHNAQTLGTVRREIVAKGQTIGRKETKDFCDEIDDLQAIRWKEAAWQDVGHGFWGCITHGRMKRDESGKQRVAVERSRHTV